MQLTKSENDFESRQLSLFGKTSPECLAPKITLSEAFLLDVPEKSYRLNRQGKDGRTLVVCLESSAISRGECLTRNISASPKDGVESFLWQVLETSTPQKYYLSDRAKAGVLRRAKARNKTLPDLLKRALETSNGEIKPEL